MRGLDKMKLYKIYYGKHNKYKYVAADSLWDVERRFGAYLEEEYLFDYKDVVEVQKIELINDDILVVE